MVVRVTYARVSGLAVRCLRVCLPGTAPVLFRDDVGTGRLAQCDLVTEVRVDPVIEIGRYRPGMTLLSAPSAPHD